MGGFAVGVNVIVSPYLLVAVLLRLRLTRAAGVAAAYQKPNSDGVTDFEFANIRSYLHHFTHHFMPTISTNNKLK